MARVTLKDVADMAGVGTATAERVLNGRGGVKPELVEKVIKAARRLDYPKRLPDKHRGVTRIEVLMSRPDLSFSSRLSQSFERIAASLDPSIVVHRTFLDEGDPAAMAAHIASPQKKRSALIVALRQHPLVTTAIQQAQASGVVVIQLMTRLEGSADLPYVGIDNGAAGRMAGLLIAGMQPSRGSVYALCHSQIYAVHRDRVRGFSDFMAKPQASHLKFRQALFTRDDAQEAARVVKDLLRSTDDLVGIYSAGGDYGLLYEALERSGRKSEICFVGHELTDTSAKALRDGTMAAVIDQVPETQARRSLDLALSRLGILSTPVDESAIRFVTITAENL